jgi:hypothetical protein
MDSAAQSEPTFVVGHVNAEDRDAVTGIGRNQRHSIVKESGPVSEPAPEHVPVCGEPVESGVVDAEPGSIEIEMEMVSFPRNPTMVLCRPVAAGRGSPMRLVYVGWAANFKLGVKLRVIPGGLGFRDVWQLANV